MDFSAKDMKLGGWKRKNAAHRLVHEHVQSTLGPKYVLHGGVMVKATRVIEEIVGYYEEWCKTQDYTSKGLLEQRIIFYTVALVEQHILPYTTMKQVNVINGRRLDNQPLNKDLEKLITFIKERNNAVGYVKPGTP